MGHAMQIEEHVRNAFRLFSESPLTYLLAGVIVSLLSGLTFGLLTGPLMGGLVYMALRHRRTGVPPSLGALTYGFEAFGNLFFYLVVLLCIFLGFLLVLVPGVIFSTWWLYALVLMVDRGTGFREAMRQSRAMVTAQDGFFPHLGFVCLVFFLPPLAIHALTPLFPPIALLNFVLPPLQMLALVEAYEEAGERPARMIEP